MMRKKDVIMYDKLLNEQNEEEDGSQIIVISLDFKCVNSFWITIYIFCYHDIKVKVYWKVHSFCRNGTLQKIKMLSRQDQVNSFLSFSTIWKSEEKSEKGENNVSLLWIF